MQRTVIVDDFGAVLDIRRYRRRVAKNRLGAGIVVKSIVTSDQFYQEPRFARPIIAWKLAGS
jgi:hypothetical protein